MLLLPESIKKWPQCSCAKCKDLQCLWWDVFIDTSWLNWSFFPWKVSTEWTREKFDFVIINIKMSFDCFLVDCVMNIARKILGRSSKTMLDSCWKVAPRLGEFSLDEKETNKQDNIGFIGVMFDVHILYSLRNK